MTIHDILPNKRDKGQVEVLSGMGASPSFIARHLNLTEEQLNEHYSKELLHGQEEANLQVAKTFHEMATSGEYPTMTLAWIKMRAGWSEAPPPEAEDDTDHLSEAKAKLSKLLNRAHNSAA